MDGQLIERSGEALSCSKIQEDDDDDDDDDDDLPQSV